MADTIEGLLQEAEAFTNNASWTQAIETYSRILNLDIDNEIACRNLAHVYALRGMFKSATDTYLRLMKIYVTRNDVANALEIANYTLALQPDSVEVRLALIDMYRANGDQDEVSARALELARLYIEFDEGDKSIELLRDVFEKDPSNLIIGRELAEMYVKYGQLERACSQFRIVADAYYGMGLFDKSAETMERLILFNPSDAGAVFFLGQIYSESGRLEEAKVQFRAALKQDFGNPDILFSLGDVCQKEGDMQGAELAYRKVVATTPDYVIAQERLADVYHMRNNITESIKSYLMSASSYMKMQDSARAIVMYQRVIALDPNNPTATRELTNLGAPVVGDDGGIKPIPVEDKKIKAEAFFSGTQK